MLTPKVVFIGIGFLALGAADRIFSKTEQPKPIVHADPATGTVYFGPAGITDIKTKTALGLKLSVSATCKNRKFITIAINGSVGNGLAEDVFLKKISSTQDSEISISEIKIVFADKKERNASAGSSGQAGEREYILLSGKKTTKSEGPYREDSVVSFDRKWGIWEMPFDAEFQYKEKEEIEVRFKIRFNFKFYVVGDPHVHSISMECPASVKLKHTSRGE